MSILWAGGEDLDFPGMSLVVETGSYFRSSYSRCGIHSNVENAPQISYPFVNGGISSCWIGAYVFHVSDSAGAKYGKFFGVADSGSAGKGIYLGISSTAKKIGVFTYDGSSYTLLEEETGTSYPGTTESSIKLDMHVVNYGGSSAITVYVNNSSVPIISFSGDSSISGVSSLDCVGLVGKTNIEGGDFIFYINTDAISEIIVGSSNSAGDTRLFSLKTMAPTGAGTTTEWTGAYTDVNEVTLNDSTVNYVTSTVQDQQYNVTDLPAGTFSIVGVVETARLSQSGGGAATKCSLGVNSGGTVDVDSAHTLDTAWYAYSRIMDTNPVTAAAWQQSEMNSLQIDLRSA